MEGFHLNDNLSLIISILTVVLGIIANIINFFKSKKTLIFKKKEINKLTIHYLSSLMNITTANLINETKAKNVITEFNFFLKELYPNIKFNISIICFYTDKRENNIENWISNENICDNKKSDFYNIINNKEFYSMLNSKKYFFVSDINLLNTIIPYTNITNNCMNHWNSLIFYPIQDNKKNITLGSLCIRSQERLNDTKKNKILISLSKQTADAFYPLLLKKQTDSISS
jgi:hypothetical protein